MSAKAKPKPRQSPNEPAKVFNDPRGRRKQEMYPLIQAVYDDDMEAAAAIVDDDPEQINVQETFAGLTPLHIAIVHQNIEAVRLLAGHPRCNAEIADHFGRTAADMLRYSSNPEIAGLVLRAAFREEMRVVDNPDIEGGLESGQIIPLAGKGPKSGPS